MSYMNNITVPPSAILNIPQCPCGFVVMSGVQFGNCGNMEGWSRTLFKKYRDLVILLLGIYSKKIEKEQRFMYKILPLNHNIKY